MMPLRGHLKSSLVWIGQRWGVQRLMTAIISRYLTHD